MQVNSFVSVKNDDLIFGVGQYAVGKDIPAGEYYFWGEHIWFTVISRGEQNLYEFTYDAYKTVEDGDFLTVENGKFTNINNISYIKNPNGILYEKHVYKIDEEIPRGYYLFRAKPSRDKDNSKAQFKKYHKYPYFIYRSVSGDFDCVNLFHDEHYILLQNGMALYYGETPLKIHTLLSGIGLPDNSYHSDGVTIMENGACTIKMFKQDMRQHLYHGETDVIISELLPDGAMNISSS